MTKIYTGGIGRVGIKVKCPNCEFEDLMAITDLMTRQGDDVDCPKCGHSLEIADTNNLYEI